MANIGTSLIYITSLLIVVYMARDTLDWLWRLSGDEPLLLAAIGIPVAIAVIGLLPWLAGAFKSGSQTDWVQIKEYVQALVLWITPSGVLLGLHFSKQRTNAMRDQNDIQRQQNIDQRGAAQLQSEQLEAEREGQRRRDFDSRFSEAFKQLNSGDQMDFLDAVRKLRDLTTADKEWNTQRALDCFADFVRTKSPFNTNAGQNVVAVIPHGPNFQLILDTICDLMERAENVPTVNLEDSDLSGLRIARADPNMGMERCLLTGTTIVFKPHGHSNIEDYIRYNLSGALVLGDLRNARLMGCGISNTDFSGSTNIPIYALTSCTYLAQHPPRGLVEKSKIDYADGKHIQLEEEKPIVTALPREHENSSAYDYSPAEWQEKWNRGEFPEPISRDGQKLKYLYPFTKSIG